MSDQMSEGTSDMSSFSPARHSVDVTEIILNLSPNNDNGSETYSNNGTNSDNDNTSQNISDNDITSNFSYSDTNKVLQQVDRGYNSFKNELKNMSKTPDDSNIVLTYFNVLLWDLLKYREHRESLDNTQNKQNKQNTLSMYVSCHSFTNKQRDNLIDRISPLNFKLQKIYKNYNNNVEESDSDSDSSSNSGSSNTDSKQLLELEVVGEQKLKQSEQENEYQLLKQLLEELQKIKPKIIYFQGINIGEFEEQIEKLKNLNTTALVDVGKLTEQIDDLKKLNTINVQHVQTKLSEENEEKLIGLSEVLDKYIDELRLALQTQKGVAQENTVLALQNEVTHVTGKLSKLIDTVDKLSNKINSSPDVQKLIEDLKNELTLPKLAGLLKALPSDTSNNKSFQILNNNIKDMIREFGILQKSHSKLEELLLEEKIKTLKEFKENRERWLESKNEIIKLKDESLNNSAVVIKAKEERIKELEETFRNTLIEAKNKAESKAEEMQKLVNDILISNIKIHDDHHIPVSIIPVIETFLKWLSDKSDKTMKEILSQKQDELNNDKQKLAKRNEKELKELNSVTEELESVVDDLQSSLESQPNSLLKQQSNSSSEQQSNSSSEQQSNSSSEQQSNSSSEQQSNSSSEQQSNSSSLTRSNSSISLNVSGDSSQEVPVTTNDYRELIKHAEKLAPILVTKDNNGKRIIDVIVPGTSGNKNEVVNKLRSLDIKSMEEGENKDDDDDDTELDQDKFDAEEDKQAEIEKATNKKKEEKEEKEKQQEEDKETERKDAVTKTEIDAEIKKEDETKNQTSNGAVKDLISDELHSIKLTKEAIGDGLKTKRTVAVDGTVVEGKHVSLTKPQMKEIRNKIKEKISKSDISAEDIKKDPERVKRILKESFTVTDLESIDSLKDIDIPETLVTNLIDQTTNIAKTVQKEKFDDTIRRINKGIIGKSFLNHGKGNHDDSLKDLYSLLGFRNKGAPKFLKDDMEFLDIMMEVNIHRNMISKEFRRLQGYMTGYVQSKNKERGNDGSHDLKSTIINKAKQILRKKINEKENPGKVEPKSSLKNSLDYLQKLSENLELYSLRLRLLTVKKMVQTKKVKNIELSDVLSTERDIVSIIKTNNPFYNSGKEELLHSQDKTKSNIQKIIVEKAKKALLKKLSTSTSTKGGAKPKKRHTIDSCYKSVLEYEKNISKIKYFNENSIRNQKFDLNNYDPTKDDLTGIIENKSRKEQSIKDFGTVKKKLQDFKKGFLSKLKPGDIPSMTNPKNQIDKWFNGVKDDTVNQFEVDTVVPFIIYYYLYSGEQHMRTMQQILIVQDKLDWKKGEEEIEKKKKAFIDLLQKKAKDVIMEHIQERRDEMISLGDLQDFEILQKSRVIMNILSDETKTEKVRLKMANMLESIVTNSLLDSKDILIHNEQNPMIQVLHDLFTGETNKEMKKAILKIVAGFLCHTKEVYDQIVGKEIRSHEKQSKLVKMCLYILKDLDDTVDKTKKTYAKNMLVYYYETITKNNYISNEFNKQETVIKTVQTISTEIGYNEQLDLRDDTFRANCKSEFNKVFLKKFITEKATERIMKYLGKGNKSLQRRFESRLLYQFIGIISKNDKIMRLAKILKMGTIINFNPTKSLGMMSGGGSEKFTDIHLLILRTYAVNGILKILENSGNDNTIRKKIIDTVKHRNLKSLNPTVGRHNLRLLHFLCAIVADGYSKGFKLMGINTADETTVAPDTHLKQKLKEEIKKQSEKVLRNLVKSTEMKQYMVTVYSKIESIGTLHTIEGPYSTIKRHNRVIRIAFEEVNAELGKKMKEANEWDFTAKELKEKLKLKEMQVNATQLKEAGFSATDLKEAGFSATDLKEAGFTATQLKEAEFTAKELTQALFKLSELKTVHFTAEQLKSAGFSATDLKEAEFTATQLKEAEFTAKELTQAHFKLSELKTAHFTASQLKSAGFKASQLKSAGFRAKELKTAGFRVIELKTARFNATDLKEAGFNARNLRLVRFSIEELKAAGFNMLDLKIAGFNASQLQNAGFSLSDVVDAAKPQTKLSSRIEDLRLNSKANPKFSNSI